jgi:hypothetical protein
MVDGDVEHETVCTDNLPDDEDEEAIAEPHPYELLENVEEVPGGPWIHIRTI